MRRIGETVVLRDHDDAGIGELARFDRKAIVRRPRLFLVLGVPAQVEVTAEQEVRANLSELLAIARPVRLGVGEIVKHRRSDADEEVVDRMME